MTNYYRRLQSHRGQQLVATLLSVCYCFIILISLQQQQEQHLTEASGDIDEVKVAGNTTENNNNDQQLALTATTLRPERLTVIAPKYLRAQGDYHVLISLANSSVPATIDLQLIGARDSNRERVEAKSVLANGDETQTVKFEVGADWPAAEYVLSINAQAIDKSWNFTGEREITYQAKVISAFIQTDKAIYKAGELVQFRALFLTPNLTPKVIKNSINVTIENPARSIIKQWTYLSNYRGLLSLEMPLTDEPMLGEYTIKVQVASSDNVEQPAAEQQQQQEFVKQFTVAEYVLPTFDVTIQLPPYATYNESDIVASVRATYTYGKPVHGHVTLTVQPLVRFSQILTRPLEQSQFRARLQPDGVADFQVNLKRDSLKQSSPNGPGGGGGGGGGDEHYFEREVEFFALVEEDLTGRKYNRTETIKVHESNVKIERLQPSEPGSLKPGLSQLMRYKVAYQDETPVDDGGPLVELSYDVAGVQVGSFRLRPSGGLIEHELNVPAKVESARLDGLEIYSDLVDVSATYRNHKHFLSPLRPRQSESGQYLQIDLPQLDQRAQQQQQQARPRARVSTLANANKLQQQQVVSVDDKLRVQVRSTEPMQQVTCQGLSRGDIVWALSSGAKNRTRFEFELKVEARMAPETRILCFYIRRENKELIADSRRVSIANGFGKNLIKLLPNRDEAKPNQEVEVSVFTKPNSLVGILALDQSVLLLKSGNDLSENEIINDLKSYGAPPPSSSSSLSDFKNSGFVGAGATRLNTGDLFDLANVIVLTNTRVYDGTWPRLGRPLANPNILQSVQLSALKAPSGVGASSIALDSLILDHALQPPEFHLRPRESLPVRVRSLFPETWLWINGTADASGQLKFSARAPDTITSWQLSAFSLNEAHGLALSQAGKTTPVRVFRPFFIKLNLPYSIIRGETLVIQAIIFNYSNSKRPITAKVTLENTRGEFEFVDAAAAATNSIQEDAKEAPAPPPPSRLVRVAPNEPVSVSFLIRPLKLGYIDIKVLAQGELIGDGIVKKLLVKPEGQAQHFNRAMLVQVGGGGGGTWRQNVSIEVPANAVPGSQKVYVSAIGDILGAGLANVDDLLRLPYGCGEQNMINLVPNIVILNYLERAGRLRNAQRERAIKNIQVGYQRQLNYKRADGSFSAFGEADTNGSVWLTAYVLKTLRQARAHVTVDARVLLRAAEFITSNARADGSIAEVGMLHNKALASSVALEGENTAAASGRKSLYLTAYSLVALLERQPQNLQAANAPETQHEQQRDVIERGLAYLEQQLTQGGDSLSTYELSIIAHVLELAGGRHQETANEAYERLWRRAIETNDGEQVHWEATRRGDDERKVASAAAAAPEDETPVNVFGSGGGDEDKLRGDLTLSGKSNKLTSSTPPPPPLKPIPVQSDQSAHLFAPNSLDVELTSWALLTAIKRNELERALAIVRWLVSKQNSLGGFGSTQDTVLAIEALAAYAEAAAAASKTNSERSIDVEFVYPLTRQQQSPLLTASSNQTVSTTTSRLRKTSLDQVLIRQSNSLVQQQIRLPDNVTWVLIHATGVGSAVVQVSWQYNLLVSAERAAFYLNPVLDRSSTINYLQLSVCTFYKGLLGATESSDSLDSSNVNAHQANHPQQQQQTQSNMAVAEIELPSGYVADVETLSSLKRNKQIKRVDALDEQTKVVVYLDQVTRDRELCFTVPAHRSSKVSNNKPVPVTIYDYYDRKQAARIFYEPKFASACDICDSPETCGEFCARAAGATSRSSGRLVSLHEQRRLKELERANENKEKEKNKDKDEREDEEAGALVPVEKKRARLSEPRNSTLGLLDAYKLLPLAAAFEKIDEAVRDANLR